MKNYRIMIGVLLTSVIVATTSTVLSSEQKADVKPYPLTKCLISGEKLGTMGKPVVLVHERQEIQFCCSGCVKGFKDDTTGFMRKLDLAAKQAAQAHPYKLDTCLVSGEKFGGEMGKPYVFVYADQEIKLCCSGCLKAFKKEPALYLKKIEKATKAK